MLKHGLILHSYKLGRTLPKGRNKKSNWINKR